MDCHALLATREHLLCSAAAKSKSNNRAIYDQDINIILLLPLVTLIVTKANDGSWAHEAKSKRWYVRPEKSLQRYGQQNNMKTGSFQLPSTLKI